MLRLGVELIEIDPVSRLTIMPLPRDHGIALLAGRRNDDGRVDLLRRVDFSRVAERLLEHDGFRGAHHLLVASKYGPRSAGVGMHCGARHCSPREVDRTQATHRLVRSCFTAKRSSRCQTPYCLSGKRFSNQPTIKISGALLRCILSNR